MLYIKRLLGAVMLFAASQAIATTTGFYYTSSPTSWVGHGETVTVSPTTNFGFNFQVFQNFDNGVSIAINDFGKNPDFFSNQWWNLDFSAPGDQFLQVGHYEATRWPFQSSTSAGLSFSGNGRGNNQLTGFFDVLEIAYDNGLLTSFAANFTQYDEMQNEWWNLGRIRINSSIGLMADAAEAPEPATLALFGFGLLGFAASRRKAKKH